MPTNALENPLVLPVLGLLAEKSVHGYGIFVQLRDRYTHLAVRRSTVYTLLDRLAEAGWVEQRPDLTPSPYALTSAGTAALAAGVARALREAPLGPSATFTTALAYLGILDPAQAAGLLDERSGRTREALDAIDSALSDYHHPELHMLEAHYQSAALRHDAQWLTATARRVRSGELNWPTQ